MKQILILLVLVFGSTYAHAGLVACVNGEDITVVEADAPPRAGCLYFMSGDGITDADYQNLRALMKNTPRWHLKHVAGAVLEKSTFEKTQADTALAAEISNQERTRIDAGQVTGEEVLAALNDLSNDVAVTTIARTKSELAADKLKARIKKVRGL